MHLKQIIVNVSLHPDVRKIRCLLRRIMSTIVQQRYMTRHYYVTNYQEKKDASNTHRQNHQFIFRNVDIVVVVIFGGKDNFNQGEMSDTPLLQ